MIEKVSQSVTPRRSSTRCASRRNGDVVEIAESGSAESSRCYLEGVCSVSVTTQYEVDPSIPQAREGFPGVCDAVLLIVHAQRQGRD